MSAAADPAAARRRALALLALLTLVWGTNWPLFPVVMREISVWTFRSISTTGAGLLLLALALRRGQPLAIPRRHWVAVGGGALVYLALWSFGVHVSPPSCVRNSTMPPW